MLKLIIRKLIKYSLIVAIIFAILVLGNVYTYTRLTDEEPIAQLVFTPINEQEFDASLRHGNFCESKNYRIHGDEWRIDARFLKWKSWATLFGANAMYRIERLSGRYAKIEDENSKIHSAHEINTDSTLELGELAEQYSKALPMIDTLYGSSAYEKMEPEKLYTVYRAQSGILVREHQQKSDAPNQNCEKEESIVKNTITRVDQSLAAILKIISNKLI